MENQVFAYRYREAAVKTANPLQLIVILYDAAIYSLQEAREQLEQKNIEGRSRAINKCISIISELQSCLNPEAGGDIASSLDRLYDYMKMRIFAANAQQNAEPLAEIEALLENLRSAWRELAEQIREGVRQAGRQDAGDRLIEARAPVAAIQNKSFNISI